MWITKLRFNVKDMERVEKVCGDIQKRDSTFIFSLVSKEEKVTLNIKSSTKDQAHKRGTWMINSIPEFETNNVGYNVNFE